MTTLPTRGLYVLTDPGAGRGDALVAAVAEAISGGAVMIQYRDKSTDHERRLSEVSALLALCSTKGVPLVVNDDVSLAAQAGADGVHLGQDDGDVATARAALGAASIIGVSCYDQPVRALEAQAAGASYVAFGRFHSSTTKPLATPASTDMLRAARPRLQVPVVAIGGVTPGNAAPLLEAGADLLAVVGAVMLSDDVRRAAAAFAPLFAQSPRRRAV